MRTARGNPVRNLIVSLRCRRSCAGQRCPACRSCDWTAVVVSSRQLTAGMAYPAVSRSTSWRVGHSHWQCRKKGSSDPCPTYIKAGEPIRNELLEGTYSAEPHDVLANETRPWRSIQTMPSRRPLLTLVAKMEGTGGIPVTPLEGGPVTLGGDCRRPQRPHPRDGLQVCS
jgi:hypothetical protein